MLDDIREVNLLYLGLAQRLLEKDFQRGLRQLDMDERVGALLVQLDSHRLQRLASSSSVLCRVHIRSSAMLQDLASSLLLASEDKVGTRLRLKEHGRAPGLATSLEEKTQ